MKPVSHVIFDMDGLLLDTERLYTEANSRMLAKFGKEFTWEVKQKQMGRKRPEAEKILVELYQLPITVEDYIKDYDKILDELMPIANALPGAEKLVKHLHAHKIPIAVATGSVTELFGVKTSRHQQIFSLFHHVLCGDDPELKHGKPAPDCFIICASRFDPPLKDMSKVLIFEDAPNGVEAALSAGSQVVMVPDPRVDSAIKEKATLALTSLEDFKPEEFGLPPFDS